MKPKTFEAPSQKKSALSVMVTTRCQARCAHCVCAGEAIPDLSGRDYSHISKAIEVLGATTLRLTGGEPTLCIPEVCSFLKDINKFHPDTRVELVTNGLFASSSASAAELLSAIPNLCKVVFSYDRFHAERVTKKEIDNLINACDRLNVEVSGFASIAEPVDLCDVIDYEAAFGVRFKYQRVAPVGGALREFIGWPYKEFENEVLRAGCPQLSSFIYIPSYGFTHCCSSLFFRSPHEMRKKLADPDIGNYFKTNYYRLMTEFSFGELVQMSGRELSFQPQDSFACELCNKVVPGILLDAGAASSFRCSA